jgi:Spy/CpxP family protein refolding chaperone
MRTGLAIFLCVSIFVLSVSPIEAQQKKRRPKTRGDSSYWAPEDLRLTPQQNEKMKTIQRRYLKDIQVMRNDLHNRRYTLRRLLSDQNAKSKDIRRKQREVFALENEIQERLLDYQLQVRDILTPQQFRLWVSKNQGRSGHGMHRGSGMGMMDHGRGMDMMHD